MENIERGTPEWDRMWGVIVIAFGDAACVDEETGEAWQYMGTHEGNHEFRHRALPSAALELATGRIFAGGASRRIYLHVPITPGKPSRLFHGAS